VTVTVLLPSLLAAQAGGTKRFELDGPTVEAALQALPVADLLLSEDGSLRPLVNVYVDGDDIRGGDGLQTALAGGETVRIVAAVAGGER
jgi:molybdopterin converting factor small subunit